MTVLFNLFRLYKGSNSNFIGMTVLFNLFRLYKGSNSNFIVL